MRKTRSLQDAQGRRSVVPSGIGARDMNGFEVDIACQHRNMQGFGRGEAQNAGAAADIEDAPGFASLEQRIEREQAADRGWMMAGPEGGAGIDLERNVA